MADMSAAFRSRVQDRPEPHPFIAFAGSDYACFGCGEDKESHR